MKPEKETEAEVVKLPLWKNCIEEMRRDGISHGKTYPAEFFEEQLRLKRDEMRFGLAISDIRRELEKDGYFLSGRGQGGNQYVILPAASNQAVMKSYGRAALDALKRGTILGTTTRVDLLAPEERRKHDSALEKIATMAALASKPRKVIKALGGKEEAKRLLE